MVQNWDIALVSDHVSVISSPRPEPTKIYHQMNKAKDVEPQRTKGAQRLSIRKIRYMHACVAKLTSQMI
jgi:hypothetical protein